MGAPVKNSSVPSKNLASHKSTPAITPESGLLVFALIVIALVTVVLTWRFGLFKKIKNYFKNKKSEIDESLAEQDD